MRSGKRYDRPLVWQFKPVDHDDMSLAQHEWREWLRVKGHVEPTSIREQVHLDHNQAVITHKIYLSYRTEYRDNRDQLSEMRLWSYTTGTVYHVVGIANDGSRSRELVVLANETPAINDDAVQPQNIDVRC